MSTFTTLMKLTKHPDAMCHYSFSSIYDANWWVICFRYLFASEPKCCLIDYFWDKEQIVYISLTPYFTLLNIFCFITEMSFLLKGFIKIILKDCVVPISYLVPATLAVMTPFFFLVRTFLFTPFWLDRADGTFMGDVLWSSAEKKTGKNIRDRIGEKRWVHYSHPATGITSGTNVNVTDITQKNRRLHSAEDDLLLSFSLRMHCQVLALSPPLLEYQYVYNHIHIIYTYTHIHRQFTKLDFTLRASGIFCLLCPMKPINKVHLNFSYYIHTNPTPHTHVVQT